MARRPVGSRPRDWDREATRCLRISIDSSEGLVGRIGGDGCINTVHSAQHAHSALSLIAARFRDALLLLPPPALYSGMWRVCEMNIDTYVRTWWGYSGWGETISHLGPAVA